MADVYKRNIQTSSGIKQELYGVLEEVSKKLADNYDRITTYEVPEDYEGYRWSFQLTKISTEIFENNLLKEIFVKPLLIWTSIFSILGNSSLPSDLIAELVFQYISQVEFSQVATLRDYNKERHAQLLPTLSHAIALKELDIPFMTDDLWELLESTKIRDNTFEVPKGWLGLFDYQASYNGALTSCKQIEIALKYAYDENVKDFIEKEINGRGVGSKRDKGIQERVPEFEKTLKDPSISQELRTHLEYTVKRCNEVIEKTLGYQKIAISEISSLFQGNNISKDDVQAIAFLTFKKLKEDGKLNGIEGINVEEVGRAFEAGGGDKTFITDIFTKVKKRAAAEKTDSNIEKVVLTIEEFLLTLWYAVKLYLCRNKEERQDINKTSDWASFLAESRASDVAAGVKRSDL
jgi:hypothetical protein